MLSRAAACNVSKHSRFASASSAGNGSFSAFYLELDGGKMNKIAGKFGGRIKRGRDSLKQDYLEGKASAAKILKDYGVDVES